jgi:hypothetical protein
LSRRECLDLTTRLDHGWLGRRASPTAAPLPNPRGMSPTLMLPTCEGMRVPSDLLGLFSSAVPERCSWDNPETFVDTRAGAAAEPGASGPRTGNPPAHAILMYSNFTDADLASISRTSSRYRP